MSHRVRLRDTLAALARQAVSAVEGGRLVSEALAQQGSVDALWAVGKAAGAMARGATQVLGDVPGLVIEKDVNVNVSVNVSVSVSVKRMLSAHPVPDARSEAAGRALNAEAQRLGPNQRAILLLSGGASSLASAPVDGVTLAQLTDATRALSRAGATIQEMNVVRRHLSLVAGGRLAQAARGRLLVLAFSDVIGDEPAAIGSGPASPDPSTVADAVGIARRYALSDELVRAIAAAPETPKPGDPAFSRVTYRLLANPRALLDAAARAVAGAGLRVRVREALVTGDLGALADELVATFDALAPGEVWVAAGEPTVRVTGDGSGGRAQHLALTAAARLAGRPFAFVALGSDGTDGPTDAAGAAVDGDTVAEAGALGRSPEAALARFDAHPLLTALGATIVTGPTGTNLTDLFLLGRAA
jgi:hydroxypyruvate reductase